MKTKCPHCQHAYSVPDDYVGKTVRCSSCDKSFKVEASADVRPADPTADLAAAASAPKPVPPKPAAKKETPVSNAPSNPNSGSFMSALNAQSGLTLPKLLLIVGFAVVVLARGCDSVGSRGVARARANEAEMQIDANEDGKIDDSERKEIEEASKDANLAGASYAQMAYFYEMFFILGTIALVAGAAGLATTGTLPERIAALAILVIVTFSIYVVGAPWLGSAMRSVGQ
jgi:predicted Zn finger-like uncharacterized protein